MGISVDLVDRDLWFLLSCYAPSVIIGFEDPTRGLLASEVRLLRKQAYQSLVSRDFVRPVSDREIALDRAIATMIQVLAHPKHTLVISSERRRAGSWFRSYHFGRGLVVELNAAEPGEYRLSALRDGKEVERRLLKLARLTQPQTSRSMTLQLPQALLGETRRLLSSGKIEPARRLLRENGADARWIEAFLPTLRSPVVNLALAALYNRHHPATQEARGFAVIGGKLDLWLLRIESDQPTSEVVVSAASPVLVTRLVRELIPVL